MSILGLLLAVLLGEGLGAGFGDVRGRGLSLGAWGAANVGFTSSSELVRLLEWRMESMEKERGFEEGMGEGCGRGKRGKGIG